MNAVTLNEAKGLSLKREILRCAQNDKEESPHRLFPLSRECPPMADRGGLSANTKWLEEKTGRKS
jgi:hypothetical protein